MYVPQPFGWTGSNTVAQYRGAESSPAHCTFRAWEVARRVRLNPNEVGVTTTVSDH